jgi:hypothetical protein
LLYGKFMDMQQAPRPVPHAEIAGEIRAELARQRKKVNDLAQHLGISRVTLYKKLGDPPAPFTLDELVVIAYYLNYPSVIELLQRALDAAETAA